MNREIYDGSDDDDDDDEDNDVNNNILDQCKAIILLDKFL